MTEEWTLSRGQGFVLPEGRSIWQLIDVDWIKLKRGEKFCRPEKGESPEDMLPKIKFTFIPHEERVLAQVPSDQLCDIGALLTPSFGKRARLPGFLSAISKDGKVPNFDGDGKKLKDWLFALKGCLYTIAHKPNEAKTRNSIVSISFHSLDPDSQARQIAESKSQAAPKKVPMPSSVADDDIPF